MNIEVAIQRVSNQHGIPTDQKIRKWVRAALADRLADAELTIRIVGEKEGAALNEKWRNKDGPTNVLSYPFTENKKLASGPLGDIVICALVIRREAKAQKKPLESHWAHIVIHGTLHLLGYDHIKTKAAAKMEKLEIKLLNSLGYANPYQDDDNP